MRTAFALAWALLPGLLWAAPAATGKDDKAAGAVENMRQALDQPVTVKIDKQTLAAAVETLRQKTKINIVLDNPTIRQQLGFAPDQSPVQVQVDLKDVKVRTALRNILAPYNLSFAIIGDTVVVTTEDMAALRQMRQRVSVDLNKVELGEALRKLGRDTATNLIVDARAEKEAKTEVSLQLEDVPLETAVRLLADEAGLKPVRVGNALFVTKKDIAAKPPEKKHDDAELAAVARQRELAALDRRWEVCDRLMEIAVRTNDDVMQSQIEKLRDRAWDVYQQRIAALSVPAPITPPAVTPTPPENKEDK